MPLPEKIGRYKVEAELGRGGMATVYRAFDPRFDREVAIKVLPREMMHDPQFRSRFEREIKMIAQLEHPSIVPVYDVGEEDEQPYFVMRFMMGGSLSNMIEQGSIPLAETAQIIGKIAQGLAYAHRKGIIHRDLKPDNILFDENGEPFISDFGVAKLSESTSNLTGSGVIGTPAYMSPEQAQGAPIDMRSDVYGLGVIVYQMLTGRQPYSADTPMGVVVKHITDPVPEILTVLPNLPPEVDRVIKTAMAKNRDERYSNTIELAKALNMAAFGNTGDLTFSASAGISARLKPLPSSQLSRRQTTGLVVAGVVLLVGVAGFFLLRNQLFTAHNPTATPVATIEVALPTQTPTLNTVTEPAFAPACSAGVAFPLPEAKETNAQCRQKIPYTSAAISPNAEFKVLSAEGKCILAGKDNEKQVLSCTGPDFLEMQIQVCAPPPLTDADLAKCPADSTFNAENSCCVAVPPAEAGCVMLEIKLKGCN
ncbi:MAG: serine/threonine protein kinase [Chloroflexi bacterium]|nr:serine/threonine protein kinase [Chloroflexota bacterium]